MKADNRVLSCDVCGRGAGGGLDNGHFSYCSSCRKFACEICWLPEKNKCRACLLPGRVADPREQLGGAAEAFTSVKSAKSAKSAKTRVPAWEWRLIAGVPMVALSVVAIVILTQGWLDQRPLDGSRVGEDVLGGVPTREAGDAATNTDPSERAIPSPAAVPTASPATLQFDFDTVRMGGGIGEGWVQSNGIDAAVAVAANPSAVDRSARLVVTQGATLETCRSVDPPMAQVHRFRVDVVLDPKLPATATIGLRDAAGDPLLTVDLAETQAALSSGGGDSVTMAEGLEPGTWYSIEVVGERVLELRVRPRDGASGSGVEMPVGWSSLHSIGEICLGGDGPSDAAVNYDNLVITNE